MAHQWSPRLSPLLGPEACVAVREAIDRLIADPSRAPTQDFSFVLAMLVEGLMPHLSGEAQHDLLLALPDEIAFYLRFGTLARRLEQQVAEHRLSGALSSERPRAIERTLLLLSARPPQPTPGRRSLVKRCLESPLPGVCPAAIELCAQSADAELDELVLELGLPDEAKSDWNSISLRRAYAAAVVRQHRSDLLGTIPLEELDFVAARMPEALDRFGDFIDSAIAMLSRPTATPPPADAIIHLEVDGEQPETRIGLVEREDPEPQDPFAALQASLADEDGSDFNRRQETLFDQFKRYSDGLALEGALAAVRRPPLLALDQLAGRSPTRVAGWLTSITLIEDRNVLRQLQSFGLVLARSYAPHDPALASRVLVHFWGVDPHVTVLIGRAKLPLRALSLFGATASPEIERLRQSAFSDAEDDRQIERLVLAAEQSGANDWLDAYVRGATASDVPADQALAITVASLRPANPLSDDILSRDWSAGFLGSVAREGRKRYERAGWAQHWLSAAASANDPRETWRLTQLGLKAADRRALLARPPTLVDQWRESGGDLLPQLRKRADKASDALGKTLYGQREPDRLLLFLRAHFARTASGETVQ